MSLLATAVIGPLPTSTVFAVPLGPIPSEWGMQLFASGFLHAGQQVGPRQRPVAAT